jgi:uncharacterized protein (DUF2267 family)
MDSMMNELFGETLEKTQAWMTELREDLEWDHPTGLLAVLRAALHALRDRLAPGEAAHLAAQLPTLIRGVYYEGWRPAAEPWKERHGAGFLARVERELKGYADLKDSEWATRAVFRLLSRHVSAGELAQVRASLPAEIRALWD